MNAWVMMLTFASRIGHELALEVGDQALDVAGRPTGRRQARAAGASVVFSVSMRALLADPAAPRTPRGRVDLTVGRVYTARDLGSRSAELNPPRRRPARPRGRRGRTRRRRAARGPVSRRERDIGMKIAAVDEERDPGRQEGDLAAGPKCHASAANSRATTVGIADWNTIAPVMLPIASVSLPWRTQITELNFSGSSVAIGAMTSASRASSTPNDVARCSTAPTKTVRPEDDEGERGDDLEVDTRSRGESVVRGPARDRGGGTGAARDPRASTSGRPRSGPSRTSA